MTKTLFIQTTTLACFVLITLVTGIDAAEVVLKKQVQVTGGMVRLADVADIKGDTSEHLLKLQAFVLFPAPPAGRPLKVSRQQVHDLLLNFGLLRIGHDRVIGDSMSVETVIQQPPQVLPSNREVSSPLQTDRHAFSTPQGKTADRVQNREASFSVSRVPSAVKRQSRSEVLSPTDVQKFVEIAIVNHLKTVGSATTDWQATAGVLSEHLTQFQGTTQLFAEGGKAPWTGRQRFWVSAPNGRPVAILADVAIVYDVIVPKVWLKKGTILRAEDLQVKSLPLKGSTREWAILPSDLIGKETSRELPAGEPVSQKLVRDRVLIRRNESVDVRSRSGGIIITAKAKAMEDGVLNQAIVLQTLNFSDQRNRKPQQYQARVTGPGTAEVSAEPIRVVGNTRASQNRR